MALHGVVVGEVIGGSNRVRWLRGWGYDLGRRRWDVWGLCDGNLGGIDGV